MYAENPTTQKFGAKILTIVVIQISYLESSVWINTDKALINYNKNCENPYAIAKH
jgi:hypothetical protein